MNDPSFVLEDVALINMMPSATSSAASKPKVRLNPRFRDFFSRTLCYQCRRGNHKGHKKVWEPWATRVHRVHRRGLEPGPSPAFETYVQCLEMLGMMSTSDPNPNTPDSNSLAAKIFATWGSALLDQTEAQKYQDWSVRRRVKGMDRLCQIPAYFPHHKKGWWLAISSGQRHAGGE